MSYYIIGKYINARLSVNYTERMETAKAGPGPTFALTLEDVRCPPVSQHWEVQLLNDRWVYLS